MGFGTWYEDKILPHIIRCGCANAHIAALRAKIVPLADGRVFEMGVGGGLNQPFYETSKITGFAGIDPSGKLLDYARKAARARGWDTDIRQGFGEAIPFSDAEFDTVVCTFTMCSVQDQGRVLGEMRRILKPGGRLLFLEHGRAADPAVVKWQTRIEPVWKHVFGNCHLSRAVTSAVRENGFTVEQTDHVYMSGTPRFAGFMEWGVGIKESN